jgi:hypothetical protein
MWLSNFASTFVLSCQYLASDAGDKQPLLGLPQKNRRKKANELLSTFQLKVLIIFKLNFTIPLKEIAVLRVMTFSQVLSNKS